jgi:hypothetical protein
MKRIVCVKERRTRVDHAEFMKMLALCYPFEFHFTPKKGSWLNIAEIELLPGLSWPAKTYDFMLPATTLR